MKHGEADRDRMAPDRKAAARQAERRDAAGQFAKSQAKPNQGGLVSANPVVLSGDGDATPGNGHGRDRDQ